MSQLKIKFHAQVWLVVLCVQQSGYDSAKRSFARPAILHNCHAKFSIFSGRRNDLHFFSDSPHQFDHACEHGLPCKLNERFVAPKSRASAPSQDIRHNFRRVSKDGRHQSQVTSHDSLSSSGSRPGRRIPNSAKFFLQALPV